MLYRSIATTAALASFACTAQAQSTSDVGALWDAFVGECSQVTADFDGYVEQLPKPGPLGERVVSQTEDGSITLVNTVVGDLPLSLSAHVIGDTRHISCWRAVVYPEQGDAAQLAAHLLKRFDAEGIRYAGGSMAYQMVVKEPDLQVYDQETGHNYYLLDVFEEPVDVTDVLLDAYGAYFVVGFTRPAP